LIRRTFSGHPETSVVGAKFTDHHELPDKPVTWTYTVELCDKNDVPVGKVSVVSISVWRDRQPENPQSPIPLSLSLHLSRNPPLFPSS
jgi:hypothetical protein